MAFIQPDTVSLRKSKREEFRCQLAYRLRFNFSIYQIYDLSDLPEVVPPMQCGHRCTMKMARVSILELVTRRMKNWRKRLRKVQHAEFLKLLLPSFMNYFMACVIFIAFLKHQKNYRVPTLRVGGTWVHVCWLCAAGLSGPLSHFSLVLLMIFLLLLVLTWCLYFLAKHSEIQEKVFQEIENVLGDEVIKPQVVSDLR